MECFTYCYIVPKGNVKNITYPRIPSVVVLRRNGIVVVAIESSVLCYTCIWTLSGIKI